MAELGGVGGLDSVHLVEATSPPTTSPRGAFARLRAWPSSLGGRQSLLLLVVLLPVLLGQLAIYYDRLGQQRDLARRENLAAARVVAVTLDAFVSDILRTEHTLGLALISGSISPAGATRIFEQTAKAYPALSDFTWLDSQGRIVASTHPEAVGLDMSDHWFYRDLKEGSEWVVGNLEQVAPLESEVLLVASGIRDEQEQLAGIIFTDVDPAHLGRVFANPPHDASFGVLDRQGMLVYEYPANPTTWEHRLWLEKQSPDVQAALKSAYRGGEVSGTFPALGGATNVLLAAAPVGDLGWVATYYRPEARAIGPLQQDIARQMGLLLLIGLAATAAAALLTRWATEPLARLRRQAAALGRGESDRTLPTAGPWEIRELANALNGMAKEVRSRERRLRENEQLLAAVLDQLPAGVLIVYASTRNLLLANEEAARIWRRPFPERLSAGGPPVFPAFYPDGRPVENGGWPLLRALERGETVSEQDLEILRGDGSRGTINVGAAPIRDAEGRILAAVAVMTDVSEKKRAEERLRESEQRLRFVVANSPDIFFLQDLDLRYVWSFQPASLLGEGELVGKTDFDLFSREDAERVTALKRQVLETGTGARFEHNLFAQGKERFFDSKYEPWRDQTGRVVGLVAYVHDITESKQSEREREAYAARLGKLIVVSEAVLAETTVEGLLQRAVDAARELIGARVATSWHGLRSGTSAICVSTEREATLPCPGSDQFAVTKGGVYLDLVHHKPTLRLTDEEMRSHPFWWGLPVGHKTLRGFLGARLLGSDGSANGLIMLSDKLAGEFSVEDEAVLAQLAALVSLALQHIESRTQAERQAEQLTALLESMTDAVTIYEASGRVLLRNKTAKRLSHLPDRPQLYLKDYERLNITTPSGVPLPVEERAIHRLLRGEPTVEMEYWVERPDGTRRRVVASGSAIRDEQGKVALAILVSRDVTELRQLEQTREEFVQIVAHDLRNPLTVIMGNAQWLQRRLAGEGRQREATLAERIHLSSRRMAAMIQDLVDSSRLETGQLEMRKETLDLCQLLPEIAARAGSAQDQARLRVETLDRALAVQADPERLERAIINLISNALKYSSPGKPVVVTAAARSGQAVVSVADQGEGISRDQIPRIFQRYYRVMPDRKREGLGLGLYITRLIIEAHGGRIWVESEPGVGSTFSFALPLSNEM